MALDLTDQSEELSVGIVVPTKNSIRTIRRCLESIREQTYPSRVVVVDNYSSDATRIVASQLAEQVLLAGPERSAQRNVGAVYLQTDILGFVDSDMILRPGVLSEVVKLLRRGAGAVIVPERTVGGGYWAQVRAYERSFYVGDDTTEAARFFARRVFQELQGFDESMTGPEDLDLTIRARALVPIARADAIVDHLEHYTGYLQACGKKGYYAPGVIAFARKHGTNPLVSFVDRPFVRSPWILFRSPLLGASVLALKVGEVIAMLAYVVRHALVGDRGLRQSGSLVERR